MSGHWKGRRANIIVRRSLRWGSEIVHEKVVHLDTDTMPDLFERYDLDEHHFTVIPLDRPEDE